MAAVLAHEDFVVFHIERHRLRAKETGVRSLDDTHRHVLAFCITSENKQSASEMDGNDDFIMLAVVGNAVHGAAQLGFLALDHPHWPNVSVCQPGKNQNPGYAHSIRNQDLLPLGVVSNGSRVPESDCGSAEGCVP